MQKKNTHKKPKPKPTQKNQSTTKQTKNTKNPELTFHFGFQSHLGGLPI